MKRRKIFLVPVVFLLILFLLSFSFGEDDFFKRGRERGVSFLSGGVSLHEREILNGMGKGYSLKIIFSNKKGEYLSDVVVKILDQNEDPILTTVSNGPWLFINLPPGTYNLEASVGGDRRKISRMNIEEGIQKVVSFQW